MTEQKSALVEKIENLEGAARLQREEMIAIKAGYDERLGEQVEAHRAQACLEEKRFDDAQRALEDGRAVMKSLEDQLSSSKQDILTLREELREGKLPSPAHKEAVDALSAQITALRLDNTELVLRARTIDARYRAGDLVRISAVPWRRDFDALTTYRMKKRRTLSTPSCRLRSQYTSRNWFRRGTSCDVFVTLSPALLSHMWLFLRLARQRH